MTKLYDLAVFGPDQPGLWIAAANAADRDLRVALLLHPLPDPGLPPFPDLPLDPARLAPVAEACGFRPRSSPFPPYLADMQAIVAGRPLDLIADPAFFRSGLERDLQERSEPFRQAAERLEQMAADVLSAASDRNFPGDPPPEPNPPLWRKWAKPKPYEPPTSPPWRLWAAELPANERAVFAAIAAAVLGFPLPADVETLTVALAWKLCRSLHHGDGDDAGLRSAAAKKIARRGAVIEAGLEAVVAKSADRHDLRLQGGIIISARMLMGPSAALGRLFGAEPKAAGALIPRQTFFLKFERDAIPDTLAPRALAVADPNAPIMGDNLFILARAVRSPGRETLAVTLIHPPAGAKSENIPRLLASALPWLNPDRLAPDDTRETLVTTTAPARALHRRESKSPALPFPNLLPLPSESLASWGLWGTLFAARCQHVFIKR
jgi:hypothetical protein